MSQNDAATPSLRWAIKRSFVDYVFRMPDGAGWVTDGATATDENELVYEWVRHDAVGPGEQRWIFRGDVRFAGHAGMLYVRIADPWVAVTGNQAVLSVVDPFDEDSGRRLDLVTMDLTPDETRSPGRAWTGSSVRLTAAGVSLFNDVYAEGELFEPLLVQLPPGATTDPEEGTDDVPVLPNS